MNLLFIKNHIYLLFMMFYFIVTFFVVRKLHKKYMLDNQHFYNIVYNKNEKIQDLLKELNLYSEKKKKLDNLVDTITKNNLINQKTYEQDKYKLILQLRNSQLTPMELDEEIISLIENKINTLKNMENIKQI